MVSVYHATRIVLLVVSSPLIVPPVDPQHTCWVRCVLLIRLVEMVIMRTLSHSPVHNVMLFVRRVLVPLLEIVLCVRIVSSSMVSSVSLSVWLEPTKSNRLVLHAPRIVVIVSQIPSVHHVSTVSLSKRTNVYRIALKATTTTPKCATSATKVALSVHLDPVTPVRVVQMATSFKMELVFRDVISVTTSMKESV